MRDDQDNPPRSARGERTERDDRDLDRAEPGGDERPAGTQPPPPSSFAPPAVSLPKGGGAIRGIGEKFAANPVTGTASLEVPLPLSPGRGGLTPALALSYDSGAGNGPFGFGWQLSLPSIARKTDRGLPRYHDAVDSDVFVLSGAEDLVPMMTESGGVWQRTSTTRTVNGVDYRVDRYRPRIEGGFARIERWTAVVSGDTHWQTVTRDNVTSWFGLTPASRVADGDRVFRWLLCQTLDGLGNAVVYEYKPEDSSNVDTTLVSERNRNDATRGVNRYLKRVYYGNRRSTLIDPDLTTTDWMFQLVLDYGEHDGDAPTPAEAAAWPARLDPFSSYRAGFEVRSYRLCRRALMFHNFPDESDVGADCLVRSIDFAYQASPVASFVSSITQQGYARTASGYLRRSMPALELGYSQAVLHDQVQVIDARSAANLPYGFDGKTYRWADLDGEGISGVVTEQAGAWFYKRNLGGGRFAPIERLATRPSPALDASGQQLVDLGGAGRLDLVTTGRTAGGYYERGEDHDWRSFRRFASWPNQAFDDPNLRLIDLDGDGLADVLVTECEVFTWYPSLGREGFGPAARVRTPGDEQRGPRLVFADAEHAIYLADMTGDGLTDLVRIRNGEVRYWPNLGYGRFGAMVTLAGAPRLDSDADFDQQRVRLADIDGSGTTDLVYLGRAGIDVYFNQSGNSLSPAQRLHGTPPLDHLQSVDVVDLFGTGTACIVWSSPLAADAGRPMRYVDLMGGVKPHLLTSVANNLGAETVVEYAPSTQFYLADAAAGRPWITRLPFVVQTVARTEIYDRTSRNRFVSRYRYHHGYFDGPEREFRGFAMVEQLDTEELATLTDPAASPAGDNFDASSNVPPVLTRSWFHTGAFLDDQRLRDGLGAEYWHEPGLGDAQIRAQLLADDVLPDGLTTRELVEACRALKGTLLRRETYALDGTPRAETPYAVSERNYVVELRQPRAGRAHAVFYTRSLETLDRHYERDPGDPRITHSLVLDSDPYGNVLASAQIAYGRSQPDANPLLVAADHARQAASHLAYAESDYTSAIDDASGYRTPMLAETRRYELTGLGLPAGAARYAAADVLHAGRTAASLAYELPPTEGIVQRRMFECTRVLYRSDDLATVLPLGKVEARGLAYERYDLSLTASQLTAVYGARVSDALLQEGGYVHSQGDADWWIPSGRTARSPDPGDTPAQELAYAQQHFFQAVRFTDPFGNHSFVAFDPYDLLLVDVRDPLGNRTTAGERDPAGNIVSRGNDYRVLQPRLTMDPNRNRAAVAFDALGKVVGGAVMGKPEQALGDSLAGFIADLDDATIAAHLADPLANPQAILQQATRRIVYDRFAYQRTAGDAQPQPPVAYALARETHVSDLAPGAVTEVQHELVYSDGFGRELQRKRQAEPGPLIAGGPTVAPRWVGSGWKVRDNKGNVVRRYEPFFTATPGFELAVAVGVSPIALFDPLGRTIGTLYPNHTWDKLVFGPWQRASWLQNDTVLAASPAADPDVGGHFQRLPPGDYAPTWYAARQGGALGPDEQAAALKSAVHDSTPALAFFDSLGQAFLSIEHNRFTRDGATFEEQTLTRVEFDIEGNQRQVSDALDRVVVRFDYGHGKRQLHSASMDTGERWILPDIAGHAIYVWDSRGHTIHTTYDELRRVRDVFVDDGARNRLVQRTVWGDTQVDPEAANLRLQTAQQLDATGSVRFDAYDWKRNLLQASRQLAASYADLLDWSGPVALEPRVYVHATSHDALDRPRTLTTPDGTVIANRYNAAGLIDGVDARLRGAIATTPFIAHAEYDALGRPARVVYGSGAQTVFEYDPLSFALVHLQTTRGAGFSTDCPDPVAGPCGVQNLRYTYDAVGNPSARRDLAQQALYFRNRRVTADNDYTFDALARLIEARGREHLGQVSGGGISPPAPTSPYDGPRVGILSPDDGNAVGRYQQQYVYDGAGNLVQMIHRGTDPAAPGWTRIYSYEEPSQLEPASTGNRLSRTQVGATVEQPYAFDPHGNTTAMPHLSVMRWDYRDRLQASAQQAVTSGTPETTYYVYDATAQRARKVTERQAAAGATPTRRSERIYLGALELYREYAGDGTTVTLERETLHVTDGQRTIALVETRVTGSDAAPAQLQRYQLGDHLGSVGLELDDQARILSYEEYYPFGSTSLQAVRAQTDTPKRYRFTACERDEESGLSYHDARYLAVWLGRWTSADPAGVTAGLNLYAYAGNNPVRLSDPGGMDPPARPPSTVPVPQPTPHPGLELTPPSILQPRPPISLPPTLEQLVASSPAWRGAPPGAHLEWDVSGRTPHLIEHYPSDFAGSLPRGAVRDFSMPPGLNLGNLYRDLHLGLDLKVRIPDPSPSPGYRPPPPPIPPPDPQSSPAPASGEGPDVSHQTIVGYDPQNTITRGQPRVPGSGVGVVIDQAAAQWDGSLVERVVNPSATPDNRVHLALGASPTVQVQTETFPQPAAANNNNTPSNVSQASIAVGATLGQLQVGTNKNPRLVVSVGQVSAGPQATASAPRAGGPPVAGPTSAVVGITPLQVELRLLTFRDGSRLGAGVTTPGVQFGFTPGQPVTTNVSPAGAMLIYHLP